MSKFVGAILIETRSIQKYVFASNELKTNVGASYIVDKIFDELLCQKILGELQESKGIGKILTDWQNENSLLMLADPDVAVEVAYIGGGNMLMFVRDTSLDYSREEAEKALPLCKKIVKKWSRELLLYAPGLKTAVAMGVVDLEASDYDSMTINLFQDIKKNQNIINPNVDLPYTGLTKECDVSGKTADAYDIYLVKNEKKSRMVSSEVKAKINAYTVAEKYLADKYFDILKGEYTFTDEFEKIGYKDGESYLSVIHIDGNNMGDKFRKCTDISKRRNLSKEVSEASYNAFRKLLISIVEEYAEYKDYLDINKLDKGNGSFLLPIRPIILGGDDITIVCPGRLGIEYTKRFIETASKDGFNCCAGVAIVPARYPFFRAYDLAEQLCSEAKKKSRDDNNLCWMDFAILHGEMSPELEQIRTQQYVNSENRLLHYGPYKIDPSYNGYDSLNSLLNLRNNIDSDIKEKDTFGQPIAKPARTKIKKLRDVLNQNMHAQKRYLELDEELQEIIAKQKNKSVQEVSADDFWENGKVTRYIDAIEIMDFCPVKKG